jgi:hypothetical protein
MSDELSSSEKLQNLIYALSPEAALLDADQTIVSLVDPEVGPFMYIGPFDDILEADLFAQGAVKEIMADLTELSDPVTYKLLPLTSPANA